MIDRISGNQDSEPDRMTTGGTNHEDICNSLFFDAV